MALPSLLRALFVAWSKSAKSAPSMIDPLIVPARSDGGYRLYGAGELQRLRTLRELLGRFRIALSDVGFARRLREDGELQDAVDAWLRAPAARPEEIPASDWLRWEQDKHDKLLHELMEAV